MLSTVDFIVGLIITPLSLAWLWFMVAKPTAWKDFVDRENAFWIRTGLFSKQYISHIKLLENGRVAKIIALYGIGIGGALIIAPFLIRH